jgi:hypothetical protein
MFSLPNEEGKTNAAEDVFEIATSQLQIQNPETYDATTSNMYLVYILGLE